MLTIHRHVKRWIPKEHDIVNTGVRVKNIKIVAYINSEHLPPAMSALLIGYVGLSIFEIDAVDMTLQIRAPLIRYRFVPQYPIRYVN